MANPADTTKRVERKCSVEGCGRPHSAKGFCASHYQNTRSTRVAEICSIANCNRPVYAKHICHRHYQRLRKHGDTSVVLGRPNLGQECSISECKNRASKVGLCNSHYLKKRRYGSPETAKGIPNGDARRWLLGHVGYQSADCLIWPYSRNNHGYGQISWVTNGKKRPRAASNLICELAHGPAPFAKAEAAHECGNGHLGCVNPQHLSWKTHYENVQDAVRHGRMRGPKKRKP
jgi:hypothetical protein